MNEAVAETGIPQDPIKLKIVGMDCGSCAMTIESSMRQLPGVADASVSFTTGMFKDSFSASRTRSVPRNWPSKFCGA